MSRQQRRTRFSELLLRLALGDAEAYQGLLGDLHEESARASKPSRGDRPEGVTTKGAMGRLRHDRAVLALACSYLVERLRRRRHGGYQSRSLRSAGPGRPRPFASAAEDFVFTQFYPVLRAAKP